MTRAMVGIQCKGKGASCYTGMLGKKPSAVAKMLGKDASDFKKWRKPFKKALYTAASERAMLELMKIGPKAQKEAEKLLNIKYAGTEDRIVRQAVWLALVHTQKRPCPKCVDILESIIDRDQENTALRALNSDMKVLKYFFEVPAS
jgi:transcription elongation factor GreA-like protein